jgi:hypothetical protein
MYKYLFSISFLLLSISIYGQEKIDTDRPDQTESTFTVPKGYFQGELGLVKEKIPLGKDCNWTLPTMLAKYGVSDKVELRLIIEYIRQGNGQKLKKDTFGFLPLQLGMKVNLLEEKGLRPRISLISHLSFNRFASDMAKTGSFLSANFRFTFQNSISDNVAIGYNLGMEWEDFHYGPIYTYTFAPGFNLGEKWYSYVEVFGFISKDYLDQHSIDGGIAYYVNDDLKVDASAGIGLSKYAPDHYFGIGVSWRFKCNKGNPEK